MNNDTNKSGDAMSGNEFSGARRRRKTKVAMLLGVAGLCIGGASIVPLAGTSSAQVSAESEGLKCTPSTGASPNVAYSLTATDGYISTPDGNALYNWSYAATGSPFQFPGPIMCVSQGDTVTVNLHNALRVNTSIQFPGLEGVTVGAVPVAPQHTAGVLRSLVQDAVPGGDVAYTFTTTKAGTFLYESGNDPQLQVQMGLFGSLVVRPTVGVTAADLQAKNPGLSNARAAALTDPSVVDPTVSHAACAYTQVGGSACDESAIYDRSKENVLMLSEEDPGLHNFMEQHSKDVAADKLTWASYPNAYAPRYFMINGRSFPDTIAPNNASWLPSQPYGGLAHVQPWELEANPLDSMLRYVAVGVTSYPFHPHSNHERVIAEDASLMKSGTTAADDQTEEKFGIMVSPGATVDATFRWTNEEGYADSSGHRLPVQWPQALNLKEGDFWSGSPYLNQGGVLNAGILGKTQCGEYYHVAHSHDLSQATNYGASFGGMLTLIRVEPPDAAQGANNVPKCNF